MNNFLSKNSCHRNMSFQTSLVNYFNFLGREEKTQYWKLNSILYDFALQNGFKTNDGKTKFIYVEISVCVSECLLIDKL